MELVLETNGLLEAKVFEANVEYPVEIALRVGRYDIFSHLSNRCAPCLGVQRQQQMMVVGCL